MKRFRLLQPDEIECRIQTCKDNGVSLLLYKTARTDADLLDETVGANRWQNDFKLIEGVLYGGIGVDYGDREVWKWDAGTESNTEKEKGRASDAFKRAGFKHGIGRELYSAPFIWIDADKCKIQMDKRGKPVCYDTFEVAEIGYDEAERINTLRITLKGREVYRMGKSNAARKDERPPQRCERCGEVLAPYCDNEGKLVGVNRHAQASKERFGAVLCLGCINKQNEITD